MTTYSIILITFLCICLGICFIVFLLRKPSREYDEEIKEEKRKKEEEIKKNEEYQLRENSEFQNVLISRLEEYGSLAKLIDINSDKKDSIYVYESTQTLFIYGQKYNFTDILSCDINRSLQKRGEMTSSTTPDSSEMAEQQVLWGMGKNYNVKTSTTIIQSPDIYKYDVYIGLKSISHPQIKITVPSFETAKEIDNLMHSIMQYTK